VTDSPFQAAAKAALPAFYAAAGKTVTYARGESSVELTAIRNDKGMDALDTEGVYSRASRREYLVKQADLVFGSVTETPQRGDTITDEDGRVFDVQADFDRLDESAEWLIPVQEA